MHCVVCSHAGRRWFALRREAERFYNLPPVDNACPRGGPKFYVPMALSAARFPRDDALVVDHVVPDDSRGRIDPVAEGGYLSDRYH